MVVAEVVQILWEMEKLVTTEDQVVEQDTDLLFHKVVEVQETRLLLVPLKVKMVEILLVLQDLLAVVAEPVEQVQMALQDQVILQDPNRVEMVELV